MPHYRDVTPEQLSRYFREDVEMLMQSKVQNEELRIEDRMMWAYTAELISKTADQLELQQESVDL